jgi:hypothetical protein
LFINHIVTVTLYLLNIKLNINLYYSLYRDENLIVKTLFYAQLLYDIISLQNIIMSRKRTFTYTVTVTLYLLNIKLNINLYNTTFITPGIRLHGTEVDTKNAAVDKKSTNRVGTVYVNVLFLDIIILIIVFIVLIDIFISYWKMIFCLFLVAKAGVPMNS